MVIKKKSLIELSQTEVAPTHRRRMFGQNEQKASSGTPFTYVALFFAVGLFAGCYVAKYNKHKYVQF